MLTKTDTMNKRQCLIIFLLTFWCILSNAQTNVSGFISSNTTWNLAGSPYIVVGNTILLNGNTLTIDPGVIVKFNSAKVLQIDGELIAVGNPNSRIRFTSNQAIPAAGDWGKIQFSDASVDAVFDTSDNYLSGSFMKYCDILYAGGIGFGAVHLSIASPYFSNCLIAYSSNDGIYCDEATFLMDSSAVKNCADFGVNINSVHYVTVDFKMYSDTIANNSGGGVYFNNNFTIQSVKVKNCSFINNQGLGGLQIIPSFQNAVITDNYFYNNNSSSNLYGSTLFFQGARNYVIACNHFIGNKSGGNGTLGFANNMSGQGNYIMNNIFSGNTSSMGSPVINMESIPQSAIHNTYILNNYISNNSSAAHPCIYIISQYTPVDTTFVDHYIENNTFINNDAPSMFEFATLSNNIGSNNFIHLKRNNFLNSLCQYEINNTIPFGVSNIEADSNYWGSTNTQHVDSVIYDFFDLGNLSVVFSLPILTSPAVIDTTCPVVLPTSINIIPLSPSTLVVFPNPATTHLTIAFDKTIHQGIIEIYNILGENVLQENIYHASKKEINVETIANGIYLLKLFDGEISYCRKIVVGHN